MSAQPATPPAPWVLLISADAAHRATLRAQLGGAGYHVVEAPSAAEGLRDLRRSERPLTVLLDAPMLSLLNAILPDRRAASHHAYLLLCDQDGTCHPRAQALLNQLALDVLPHPDNDRTLLDAVRRATRRLAPASPYA